MEHGASGLVLLHLNGAPYTQKPPLYYWLAAGAGSFGGRVDEWAARIPSAIAGLGCLWVIVALANSLFKRTTIGLLAAGLLLTSFRFVFLARRAQLDVLLTFFEALAILAYARFVLPTSSSPASSPASSLDQPPDDPARSDGDRRRRGVYAMHAFVGLATLIKGPVGWLPFAIAAVHLAWEGRRSEIRTLFSPLGLALSVGPLLVWFTMAAAIAPVGFVDDALIENVLGRLF